MAALQRQFAKARIKGQMRNGQNKWSPEFLMLFSRKLNTQRFALMGDKRKFPAVDMNDVNSQMSSKIANILYGLNKTHSGVFPSVPFSALFFH